MPINAADTERFPMIGDWSFKLGTAMAAGAVLISRFLIFLTPWAINCA
jgi:hypothetical protein